MSAYSFGIMVVSATNWTSCKLWSMRSPNQVQMLLTWAAYHSCLCQREEVAVSFSANTSLALKSETKLTSKKFTIQSSSFILLLSKSQQFETKLTYCFPTSRPDEDIPCL